MSSASLSVSAVVNCYNSAAFLREALESILHQSHLPDEIVIVDDGSVDDTARIAKDFVGGNIRYIYQENQGLAAARNTGIRATSGDVLVFLDADDTWLEHKTEQQLKILASDSAIGLVSGHRIWWEPETDQRKLIKHSLPRNGLKTEILIRNFIGNASMIMIRRSVLDRAGWFDPALRYAEDLDLWIRVVAETGIAIADLPVIIYRSHPASLTHQNHHRRAFLELEVCLRAIEKVVPKWLQPSLRARAKSKYYYQLGFLTPQAGSSYWNNIGYAALSLVLYPWELPGKKIVQLAKLLLGGEVYARLKNSLEKSKIHGDAL
jgi:glycosyltransferase involved in cell wall biosynthesis